MVRKIIRIDESKCIGCSLCISACQENAIRLIEGKAKLLHDDYCDGFGNCLPICPTGAITLEERQAEPFYEAAARIHMGGPATDMPACACHSTHANLFERENHPAAAQSETSSVETHLNQWPVQIRLVPQNAPYFNNADVLIAADCTAYAYGGFHGEYMKNRITLIGCPKLDGGDYSEKLTAILKMNEIQSVTVTRMEVHCCSGIVNAVRTALQNCGKRIPYQVVTISTDGRILKN